MDRDGALSLLIDLYHGILNRDPDPRELEEWINVTLAGAPPEEIVHKFVTSSEHRELRRVPMAVPAGHFYSPIVDPQTTREYVNRAKSLEPQNIPGIRVNVELMREFWQENLESICGAPFSKHGSKARYRYVGAYPPIDAVLLYAVIRRFRPEKIVEVGCGHSTLCMLDASDDGRLDNLSLTCIDPFPDRMLALLRSGDDRRLDIIRRPLQEVDLDIFKRLTHNDILFLDSTHVLKTGSDVHYALFSILPALQKGVIVHFHDIVYPFEYPDRFIFDLNNSWNEAYALRAFLMYNAVFEIILWGSLLARTDPAKVAAANPELRRNSGGSIWLRKAR